MNRLILAAVLLAPSIAGAAGLESLSASSERDFMNAPLAVGEALAPQQASEPFLQPALKPAPFRPQAAAGEVLGRLNLAAQLDRNLHVTNYKFGARPLDLGIATDAGFRQFFFTFTDRAGTVLAPVGSLSQLRGRGVDARIDASTVYNFKLKINIFNPIRGSTLEMNPTAGTSGPSQSAKSGAVLDAVRARAVIFSLDGSEYWLFYGRDALAGGVFAKTRSFLFVHMDGLSSKAWPLAESALKADAPAVVSLGDQQVSVTLASSGELVVRAAR
ncbi:MAG TPA: hypothetical protein VN915_01465 [Elusimicrobiota bacterium]|nr:hypothetical protein [Elusimicrobiota bacterium]